MKATNLLFVRLVISLFHANRIAVDAWTAMSPCVANTQGGEFVAIAQRKEARQRVAFSWEDSLPMHRRTNRICAMSRRRCRSKSSLRISTGDDYDEIDLIEEEFYQEYENMYNSGGSADQDSSIADQTRHNKQQQQQQRQHEKPPIPPPSKVASNNGKKAEVAKAWDEAMLEESTRTTSASDSNGDAEAPISNLSDLQQRLRQIQKRNNEPIKQPDIGKRGDNDVLSFGRGDAKKNPGEEERKRGTAADELGSSDRYLDILRKAEQRLSEMKSTSVGSDFKANAGRMRMVTNMAGLQERLNQIQKDASLDTNAGTASSPSKDLPNAKRLDDDTLAEWQELENQLQREADERTSQKPSPRASTTEETTDEISIAGEAAILDALRSQVTFSNSNNSDNVSDNEEEDSAAPNDIPASHRKYMTDYQVTEDGGVFLSPEAYTEACNNANRDGSLNFDGGSSDENSDSQRSSPVINSFVEGEPPMAPYEQGTIDSSGNSRPFTIQDLTREASRSIDYARDNPDAQEELHRRIMAEAEEAINNEFEKEIMMDPEKANAFWNQEYFDQRKEESNALDRLLDQKLQQLEEEERDKKNRITKGSSADNSINEDVRPQVSESQERQYLSDRNLFFASREERINLRRMIERNRRKRAKNIANFYKDVGDDSSWNLTSESKEIERISEQQAMLERNSVGDSVTVGNVASVGSLESIEESNVPDGSTNNNNAGEDNGPERKQKSAEGLWVLVEDPESPEDEFYWNEVTGEMRWDPPQDD